MKQVVLVGIVAGALAAGVAAQAEKPQTAPKPATQTAKPAAPATQPPTAEAPKPEPAKRPARRAAAGAQTGTTGHTAPKPQPATEEPAAAPTGTLPLGTVHIPAASKADGKPLAAGTYQLRLTPQEATPDAKGQTEQHERWVEFVKGGQVVGREVVVIIPQAEIDKVQKDAPPRPNSSKFEKLVGGDYYRVWLNKGGNHYLVYLVPA